jgi:glycosyltransferase involved in cell wall biosynthesis
MKKTLSIITPTFNEEENIEDLCKAVANQIDKLNYDYEHIVIDNNSTDKTIKILRKLASNNKKL